MKPKDPTHYVVTDAKYCLGGPFFYTEVIFRSKSEIVAVIAALEALLKSESADAHFHIADFRLAKDGPASSAEIIFFGPLALEDKDRSRERRKDVECAERLLREVRGRGR